MAELATQRFDNVVQQFEDLLSGIEHTIDLTENAIDKVEAEGYLVSVNMYKSLKKQQEEQLATLSQEYTSLQTALSTAMAEGKIEKYSEDWYTLVGQIQDVEAEISSVNNDLAETNNLIRETPWNIFDKMQEMLGAVQKESDWIIDLLSNEKMFDEDTAAITDQGQATLGLHAVNYNAYMSQANDYANEIEKINKDLAKDPYNTILLDRKNELIEAHREAISSAKDEQQALKDLASDGYDTFLSVMDKAIDKRKELLSVTKDMYDYEKNVAEQTKEIANLEKQLKAYGGDNSEATKATVQQLKVSLEEAKENLEETEYDKYISDQEQMLDALRDETEEWINERLDNFDQLLREMIDYTNTNAENIQTTLETETDKVGTTLSTNMGAIWSKDGEFASIVTMYGDGFNSALTTTNSVLNSIREYLKQMVADSNKKANEEINKPVNTPNVEVPKQEPPKTNTPTETPKTNTPSSNGNISVGGKINAGNARIYATNKGTGGGSQYFDEDPIYTVLGEENGYVKVRWHKLSSGVSGWFKKSDVKAYSTGGLIDYDGLAAVHGGKKPELVLNSKDTENFIALKDVLKKVDSADLLLGQEAIASLRDTMNVLRPLVDSSAMQIPQMSARSMMQNVSVEIGDIQMYGVNDPETFAAQLKHTLQTNKSITKIIQADTLGIMTGKNGLSKFKY